MALEFRREEGSGVWFAKKVVYYKQVGSKNGLEISASKDGVIVKGTTITLLTEADEQTLLKTIRKAFRIHNHLATNEWRNHHRRATGAPHVPTLTEAELDQWIESSQ